MNTATEAPFKSVDENYQFFKSSINDSIRNHIPQKNISGRWNVPWLTTSIKLLTRKKQTLYIIKQRTGDPSDWKKFKELFKYLKKQLSVAHNEYVSEPSSAPEESNPSKPVPTKRFWSYIRSKKSHDVGVAPLKDNNVYVNDSLGKAHLSSNQFKSVFTQDPDNTPYLGLMYHRLFLPYQEYLNY